MPRRSSRPPGASAYEAGLRHLARRAHSRVELRRKLLRRGYDAEDVDSAMARLAGEGYLDDAGFAAGHVRRRSASLGPLALSAELAARGVGREVAGAAVAALGREAQLTAATRLVVRQAARKPPAGYKELLESAGARLLRRGFSPAVAREACRAVWLGMAGTSALGPSAGAS
ncbi:MAG TPA: RecX family transcriptional regulator [Candidatus Dormibacteraeota bacterium]|nr:RecX family transcriptional regulator [Candidatus Dormibacteraeota bacterium]